MSYTLTVKDKIRTLVLTGPLTSRELPELAEDLDVLRRSNPETLEILADLSGVSEIEIDIFEFAVRGEEVPHAKTYYVRIDGEMVKIDTPHPTGEMLLRSVGKRPCAFELIEEFVHHQNDIVEPEEKVNLRKHGLKGFITAHKEIVTNIHQYRTI